ncbi:MAG TPA: SprT family zinc-dependent metalloprotease [Candidatus Krumholzibacteria bacterium]|nr:SprT family zinc-dependent metalloprotease [Candidatus Krumholzibacteria bacterium]HRY42047.1 SprT family zinc-dependent metalloprotease [Candidatus Krumholzibacteria bacterium]
MLGNREGEAALIDSSEANYGGYHRIRFGSQTIDCLIRFGPRNRLRICVHPNQKVIVDAPEGKSLEDVLQRVRSRGGWIVKQRQFFEQFLPRQPEKNYVSGETFCYLGRQYRLKVVKGGRPSARLAGKYLTVHIPDKENHQKARELIQHWYQIHARDVFDRRLVMCHDVARRYGIEKPHFSLRRMTRRWGSTSGNGRILLNTELVKAPIHCIDYVIMHELCHQKYPNHSLDFFRLLTKCMPDWESRKDRLEQVTF